jgi:glutamyl-tRNA reductase
MHISLVGINFHTAAIELQEKLAISSGQLYDCLELLRVYIPNGVILSTCNRTEVYTVASDSCHAEESILTFFKSRLITTDIGWISSLYCLDGEAAVAHLFRVAGSLESMIVGEYEVLGQVRSALRDAEKLAMVNLPLRRLFQSAIRTGRRIRRETEISKNAISVSSLAVDLAIKVVGDLKQCKLMVIGTGEAGELVAKIAKNKGVASLAIAGRTKKRAQAMAAKIGGIPVEQVNLIKELSTSNIVVTCSSAPHKILDASLVKKIMRNRGKLPLAIIDIGIPRNVEPEVASINNVQLYNIDDILQLSRTNRIHRERQIDKAEEIIADEIREFAGWWHSLEVKPLVRSLLDRAEKIRSCKLLQTTRKLPALSKEDHALLEVMTKSIVARILHDPVFYLKATNINNHHDIFKNIFNLK